MLESGGELTAQALEPSSPSAPADIGVLGPGSRGEEVKNLQRRLQTLGYYKGSIDGNYGPETVRAVSQFQRYIGFSATGYVDPATWQRIEISQLLPSSGSAVPDSESDSTSGTPTTSATQEAPSSSSAVEAPSTNSPNASTSNTKTPLLAQPSLSPAPDQQEETLSQDSSGWLLGLLILGIFLLSVGTGLFFAKRSANKSLELDYDDGDRSVGLPDADSGQTDGQTYASSHGAARRLDRRNGLPSSSQADAAQGIAPAVHSIALENNTTRLSPVNIIDELVGELQSPDPTKRRKAIWELGQRGDSNAVQPLVDLIIDADSKERSLILAALSEIGIRVLKPMNRALAISLQDPNPEVRKNAIRDLTRIYDTAVQVSQMLTHVTEDPDPEVRETAVWALDQLNRIRSIPEAETILSLRDSAKSGALQEGADLTTDFLQEEVQHSSEW
ncbi:MAG: peptidoglycan-binding protein [Leptolyngbyaceae cyanobacterium MO_188.B28]|nr:peptidoglycan-binding protein [Leptolyngbyaceae cyanobacterium MO_188.B28]